MPSPLKHRQQITVASGGVGAASQMASRVSTSQIQPQYSESGTLQAEGQAAQPLSAARAPQPMQDHHQGLRRWCSLAVRQRTIQIGQQFASFGSATGQGRH